MSNPLQKTLTYLLIILIAISAVFFIAFFVNVVTLDTTAEQEASGTTDLFLLWAIVLIIFAAGGIVVSFFIKLVSDFLNNPKSLYKLGVIAAAVVVIFVISKVLSSDSVDSLIPGFDVTKNNTTPGEISWSDTGLYVCYIVLGLTFISAACAEIKKAIS